MSAKPLSVSDVCDAEYRSARRAARSLPPTKKAGRSVTAPPAGRRAGNTGRNHAAWVQISLFLQDRVVNP